MIMKRDLNQKGRAYYQNLRTKFLASAKEAASSGDRVLSEYNLQIAEHYARVISERFGNHGEPRQFQGQMRHIPPERTSEKSRSQDLDPPPVDPPSPSPITSNPEDPVKTRRIRRVRTKLTSEEGSSQSGQIVQDPVSDDVVVRKRRVSRQVRKDQS
jgi:hypothetical protein